eukprot:TRINITY_DN81719_c1_g2_i2.p1 TRINITY_DN81719_c1_g2~~TRINITY_DN81719_c1_g2_i2.p1  ORF type:complete len:160 (-),score=7.41 TRINITY_DN81719_c1_g2_i2:95-535(-)
MEVLNIPRLLHLQLNQDDLTEETEKLVGWVVKSRVNGVLAMTRSIGDILIKDHLEDQFEGPFKGPIILATPEVTERKLTPEDEFVVIGCDGLFDVLSSQEVVDLVRKYRRIYSMKGDDIATAICREAFKRGSLDNISLIIIFLERR